MEGAFTCFAHRNYREHSPPNVSKLFDLENSCNVNCLLQGSPQALLPSRASPGRNPPSNPRRPVCMLSVCPPPPGSSVAAKLSDAAVVRVVASLMRGLLKD